jgi:A/G-specific adenine glycosylase
LSRTSALLEWYGHNRRDLPWRHTTDPWRILVSEVMLQQTQASRVVDPYRRFLDRFPTPASMAESSTADVLSLWMGLGYNSRVLRLRDAATLIVRDGWPRSVEGLRALPGVGPYTAAAVACFSFGKQVPAIDTNLRRVLSRWVGRPLDGPDLATTATELLPDGDAVDWNQAMMDLGASICRRVPECGRCPVAKWCADPSIYVAPRPQGRYEGSVRQTRAAILRTLLDGDADVEDLRSRHGHADAALGALETEGLIAVEAGRVSLA